MEEADKDWMMIRMWVNVSSGTGSPGQSRTKGHYIKMIVVAVVYVC